MTTEMKLPSSSNRKRNTNSPSAPIKLPLLFGLSAIVFISLIFLQSLLVPPISTVSGDFHNGQQQKQRRQQQLQRQGQEWKDHRHHKPNVESTTKMNNTNSNNPRNNNNNPYLKDKDKIIGMLQAMSVDPYAIDNETWAEVPTWTQVQQIWGTEPKIYGLYVPNQNDGMNFCASFRNSIDEYRRHIAVGGVFSTGTNLLAQLLQHNCGIPERIKKYGRRRGHGMEWQVPWGKHNPYRYRGKHYVKDFNSDRHHPKLQDYLPAVTIRDPYSWMTSMCRHPYTVRWPHLPKNCPNLLKNHRPNNVSARFGADKTQRVSFDSLAHMWNVWYGEYFNETKHPLVMVRFEDLIFYPKEVTQKVCECAGGELMKPHQVYSDKDQLAHGSDFHYVVGSSLNGPGHGRANPRHGLIDAWIKYAKVREERTSKFSKSDYIFSEQNLDKRMTKFFGYA
mmetsp:Transcript_7689/g.10977  ORF Transcript_7689/g.10977 Transcript_7689/m.10977 type:complete len:448 (-) Transcript_7689:7-1350(-)